MYKITLNKRIYIYKSCYKVCVQLPSSHSVTKSSFGYKLYIWPSSLRPAPSLRPAAKFQSGRQVSIRPPSPQVALRGHVWPY